jgi:hypothetical protein
MNIEQRKAKPGWRDWLLFVAFTTLVTVLCLLLMGIQISIRALIPASAHFGLVLACAILFLPFVLVGRLRIAKGVVHGIFLMAIIGLWFSPIESRQPFLRDLASVQPGMTPVQVNAIMGKYWKGTNWRRSPFPSDSAAPELFTETGGSTQQTRTDSWGRRQFIDSITYRHSDEAEYNADFGVVSFSNGRVTNVEFSPD